MPEQLSFVAPTAQAIAAHFLAKSYDSLVGSIYQISFLIKIDYKKIAYHFKCKNKNRTSKSVKECNHFLQILGFGVRKENGNKTNLDVKRIYFYMLYVMGTRLPKKYFKKILLKSYKNL